MNLIPTITLENFEGPLDLLLHLIQRDEINIYTVEIQTIIKNFLEELLKSHESSVDSGAEFLGGASSLLLLKSKKLLPNLKGDEKEEVESYVSILKDIIEYCSFKDLAKKLSDIEGKEESLYPRGVTILEEKPALATNTLSLEELMQAFEKLLKKQIVIPKKIQESALLLSDYILSLQNLLFSQKSIFFQEYFSLDKSKDELIVSFLALLQLMKEQKAIVTSEYLIKMVIDE
ncbi:MAG: segregation/condensation protein A [Chlamydiales bacterium]|nr:segregation/condensation protein A [Chlamydiales bacterium]